VGSGLTRLLAAVLLVATGSATGAESDNSDSLTALSIEDLMDIEVSLVSRKAEKRADVPAAIYVITREDIERSPALSVPELLRNVPGVNVARIDASKWSITIRGFSGQLANKLQVLVDGRSIFTPVFAGVAWEDHFMPLDLIERIEVIRGPGGATWGANAVNGIINIITKDAEASEGTQITAGAGTELESIATIIHGGKLEGDRHYRAYLHQMGMRESDRLVDNAGSDAWRGAMGGFRWDASSGNDTLSFQVDGMANRLYDSFGAPLALPPAPDVLTSKSRTRRVVGTLNWTRELSDESQLQVLASVEHYEFDSVLLGEKRNLLNIDFQHQFAAGQRHEFVWGLGAGYYFDHMTATRLLSITPERERYRQFSGFFQDQIHWLDGQLALTLGARAEYTDQADFQIQPSIRLAWTPEKSETTWWAAISRAVNNPSRGELGSRLNLATLPGFAVALAGNSDFEAEELLAYEIGVRSRLRHDLVFDATLFYNDYDQVRTFALSAPRFDFSTGAPALIFPFSPKNDGEATAIGFEITFDWEPLTWWRTRLGWSWLEVEVERTKPGIDPITPGVADNTPAHQVFWQHHFNLPHQVALDVDLRYVGELESLGIDAYTSLDLRLGWAPRDDLLLEIVGQNLLDSSRHEYETSLLSTVPSGAERGVYGSVTWKF
jgi:iron complex outermembrane receptor protein